MAWQIVKDSFSLLKTDLKHYILWGTISFFILFLGIFFKSNHWAYTFIMTFSQIIFVYIPIFIIFFQRFHKKNLFPLFSKKAAMCLLSSLICAVALTIIEHLLSKFNFNNNFSLQKIATASIILWFDFIWIEIIMNNSSLKNAARDSFKTFFNYPIKNIWLLIKINIVEEIISLSIGIVFVLIFLPFAVLFPQLPEILEKSALWVFGFIQAIFSPYYIINTCCYYMFILSQNTCKE